MKKYFFYSFILSFLLVNNFLLGDEKSQTYDYNDFTGVSVGWGMHLKVTKSDKYNIEIKADERDFKYLKVEKHGENLKVFIDKHNFHRRADIYVFITMPELNDLNLSGGSIGRITMESSNSFSADLSGGSSLEGDLKCSDMDIELSGGSKVNLTGSGDDLKIEGSGGSIVRLKSFDVKNVDADLSGGSNVVVKMNGTLSADASGGSQIRFYGHAKLGRTSFSGGSGISQED